jgi:formylmethanofuran dehydrogenase subunit E
MTESNKKVINSWENIINPKEECSSCEGVFALGEQKFRDYNNKLYCEACYKERYSFYA